jgi:hypothetical protein
MLETKVVADQGRGDVRQRGHMYGKPAFPIHDVQHMYRKLAFPIHDVQHMYRKPAFSIHETMARRRG